MIINIKPVELADGTVCSQGRLSASVSDSVAIRVVPIDLNGVEHPEATQAVIGAKDDYAIGAFLDIFKGHVESLVRNRT